MSSRRQYLTQAELTTYAEITIIDPTEADVVISQAEELIDSYVGYQDQFFAKNFSNVVEGLAQGGSATQLTLENRHANVFQTNFFTFCEVEIIGGTGAGQRTVIASSTYPNTVLMFKDTLTTALDSTSFYRIYQLGKFPRRRDVYLDAINPPTPIYYKNIPEEVKRAVAAQVEYMINMPDQFFKTDDLYKDSEKIGDYAYTKARNAQQGMDIFQIIAPKAKILLRGLVNKKGRIIVGP